VIQRAGGKGGENLRAVPDANEGKTAICKVGRCAAHRGVIMLSGCRARNSSGGPARHQLDLTFARASSLRASPA